MIVKIKPETLTDKGKMDFRSQQMKRERDGEKKTGVRGTSGRRKTG